MCDGNGQQTVIFTLFFLIAFCKFSAYVRAIRSIELSTCNLLSFLLSAVSFSEIVLGLALRYIKPKCKSQKLEVCYACRTYKETIKISHKFLVVHLRT